MGLWTVSSAGSMAWSSLVVLLIGATAVLAFPQPAKELQESKSPSWWPDSLPWPPQHPEWIPWPPANWFPEDAPSWWPNGWPWPPQRPSHPEWIPWPPQHPEWIPWPPQHPEWIPWPPQHPEWIPWPPQHPEWIPWPPANWFPEDAPSWWPDGWPWPPPAPSHPEWIPWPPTHPEWIPWPPQHPEWIPWPPSHPGWLPTEVDNLPYQPSRDNQFHLFTRANPVISQPLIYGNDFLLAFSHFDPKKKTVIIVHNVQESAVSQTNAVLVPALLDAGDVNVILVDWSEGANKDYGIAEFYSVFSGRFVSVFLNWLAKESHADLSNFHLVGYGVGGINVGFIGRLLGGKVGYVTALDPTEGRVLSALLPSLTPEVAEYTEVIHTNFNPAGYSENLGHVEFFPNGGVSMPGCAGQNECSSFRSVYYFAESLHGSRFIGTKCDSHEDALQGNCDSDQTLALGGLEPKTGTSGKYFLQTNPVPPFAQG